MSKLTLCYPVKPFIVTQSFGVNGEYYRANGINIAGHNGLDLRALHGQPVYASHDGTCFPEIDDKQGNGIVIRSDEEVLYDGKLVRMKTIYWHLIKADAVVKTGQKVKTGDLIGYADNTGFSNGDHLHYGLKPQAWNESDWTWANLEQNNGYFGAIDPTPFFNGIFAIDYMEKLLGLYRQYINLLNVYKRMVELLSKKK